MKFILIAFLVTLSINSQAYNIQVKIKNPLTKEVAIYEPDPGVFKIPKMSDCSILLDPRKITKNGEVQSGDLDCNKIRIYFTCIHKGEHVVNAAIYFSPNTDRLTIPEGTQFIDIFCN